MPEPTLDETALEQRLDALERARAWSPRTISKLETLLRTPDDTAVFRVNPVLFASERQLPEAEAVDLFVIAASVGLFAMEWQLVCPQCTDAVEVRQTLSAITRTFHCDLCRLEVETSVDDLIHVSFTVSPTVRRIAYHTPEQLPIADFCFKYHFATRAITADGTPFTDHIRPMLAILTYADPHGVTPFETVLRAGTVVGADRVSKAEFGLQVEGEPVAHQRIDVVLEGGRFHPERAAARPGPATIAIDNRSDRRAAISAINPGPGRSLPRPQLRPFLTGKRLFVTQAFRDRFRGETVGRRGGLGLKDLSVLFTDLRGSTELYDQIGDLQAFQLVEVHFDRLGTVVRRHRGAIVKTIGDAIMATFATPAEAVAAGLDMLEAVDALNAERGRADIGLKVGVHRGPSIAVNADERLDYFGQTVNVAARVQGLADAGELVLTSVVRDAPGVAELLSGRSIVEEQARLKGVSGAQRVVRVRR